MSVHYRRYETYLMTPGVFSGVCDAQSLIFCVMLC